MCRKSDLAKNIASRRRFRLDNRFFNARKRPVRVNVWTVFYLMPVLATERFILAALFRELAIGISFKV